MSLAVPEGLNEAMVHRQRLQPASEDIDRSVVRHQMPNSTRVVNVLDIDGFLHQAFIVAVPLPEAISSHCLSHSNLGYGNL